MCLLDERPPRVDGEALAPLVVDRHVLEGGEAPDVALARSEQPGSRLRRRPYSNESRDRCTKPEWKSVERLGGGPVEALGIEAADASVHPPIGRPRRCFVSYRRSLTKRTTAVRVSAARS